jgi:hypothetical protein
MAPTKKASIAAEPTFPLKKNLHSNFKYSPQKKTTDKSNQVFMFVKEYKFGVISLTLKKG